MNQPVVLQLQDTLTLPAELLRQYGTRFLVTPLNGGLFIEPAGETGPPTFTLTSEEELRLEQSLNEQSTPLSALARV